MVIKIKPQDLFKIKDLARRIYLYEAKPINIESDEFVALCYLKSVHEVLKIDFDFTNFEFHEYIGDDD